MLSRAGLLSPCRYKSNLVFFNGTLKSTVDGSLRRHTGVSSTSLSSAILRGLRNVCCSMASLSSPVWATKLKFDNQALRTLPVDESGENTPRQVAGACFSLVNPTPVENPRLVCAALPALRLLDIPEESTRCPEFSEYFSGNRILPGSETAAHCYCGHQFGYFSGQLGDGAAMYLGEVINKAGDRWEIQLKGAGLTPFSRSADGRKVLRSSIREFLCSEAIHHLGIPTTRAGSCVTSDSKVIRDIFYDGRPIRERCTVVLRIAPTFLRFGSFEIFKSVDRETGRQGPSVGQKELLSKMLDYTVQTFYPQIWDQHKNDKDIMYVEFYKEIVRRTARMVAAWQCVGWCHGVLNTDNMSIVGVTIDYGPFGFMDRYDPDFICNGSDDGGRYSYKNQPSMCKWNCMKLGEAIKDAVPTSETRPHLDLFDEEFDRHYQATMRKKFGLKLALPEDEALVTDFLSAMQETGGDFTNCFRHLSDLPLPSAPEFEAAKERLLVYLVSQSASLEDLKKDNAPRMDPRQMAMMKMLADTNPGLLEALGRGKHLMEAELQRMDTLEKLMESGEEEVEKKSRKAWGEWLESYTLRLRKEEEDGKECATLGTDRKRMMNSANPRYVLRNYIAQKAIDAAESGDYSQVQRVLEVLQSPYTADDSLEVEGGQEKERDGHSKQGCTTSIPGGATCSQEMSTYDSRPPAWAADLKVT